MQANYFCVAKLFLVYCASIYIRIVYDTKRLLRCICTKSCIYAYMHYVMCVSVYMFLSIYGYIFSSLVVQLKIFACTHPKQRQRQQRQRQDPREMMSTRKCTYNMKQILQLVCTHRRNTRVLYISARVFRPFRLYIPNIKYMSLVCTARYECRCIYTAL